MSRIGQEIPRRGENHSPILLLMGESASGKTTLGGTVRRRGLMPEGMNMIEIGNIIFERAREIHPEITSRDQLRTHIPLQEMKLFLREAVALSAVDALVTNTPTTLIVRGAYRQPVAVNESLPPPIVSDYDLYIRIKPKTIIHISADPEELVRRREADSRQRERQSEDVAEFNQRHSLMAAIDIAKMAGSKLVCLWNRDDNLEENLAKVSQEMAEI